MNKFKNQVDVPRLHKLISTLRKDAKEMGALSPQSMLSIAEIIENAIGMPVMTYTRDYGAVAADKMFPGSPQLRAGFNAGVAWTIQQWPNLPLFYSMADEIKHSD